MDDLVTTGKTDQPAPESQSLPSAERQERLAAWLQFPRRTLLLLIAFGATLALFKALRRPMLNTVGAIQGLGVQSVSARLPNTLLLLTTTMFTALALSLAAALVAVLVHKLEERTGPLGSVLKGLGRLWIFGQAAIPAFCTALLLMFIFAFWLRLLPAGGMLDLREPGASWLADRIRHLILPTLALAFLPAALTAQATAREVTLPRERIGVRVWLAGLFEALGTLSAQVGGILSATLLVETVFAWPGIGRLVVEAVLRQDVPVLFGVLTAYAVLVLIGRLVAEFFRWLARLLRAPILSPQPDPTPWRRTARKVWVIAALVLLLAPLALAITGLTVDPEEAVKELDLGARDAPPSAEHPWGTDTLGRDVQKRVLRGGLIMLETVGFVAAVTLVPSGLGGALTGCLASRRVLWAESLADLLLLPADALLFIPTLPAIMVITVLSRPATSSREEIWIWVGLATAVVLLPRATRAYQALWTTTQQRKVLMLALIGPGALLLATMFAGLWVVAALDFLGLGTPPPIPTLSGVLGETLVGLHADSARALAPGVTLWICSFTFYTAADALIGYFHTKDALARMNE